MDATHKSFATISRVNLKKTENASEMTATRDNSAGYSETKPRETTAKECDKTKTESSFHFSSLFGCLFFFS